MGSVLRFRSKAGEGVRIGGGSNIVDYSIVYALVSNFPLSGGGVLNPAQHHAAGADFRSGKGCRPAAVGHGAADGVVEGGKA